VRKEPNQTPSAEQRGWGFLLTAIFRPIVSRLLSLIVAGKTQCRKLLPWKEKAGKPLQTKATIVELTPGSPQISSGPFLVPDAWEGDTTVSFTDVPAESVAGMDAHPQSSRMSLKAKLEAVIYAAEEPVTLAQLANLFADEALALQAEQAAANAESVEEAESSEIEASEIATIDEPQENLSLRNAGTDSAETAAEANPEAAQEPPTEELPAPAEITPEEEAKLQADAEAEARREARQRDRQVREILRTELESLIADYATGERGIEIREIAGGFRMATKPEYHDAVRGFVKSLKQPMKLSLQALETLAVIAYKQPVTSPEISEIRGVDSGGVLGSLLSRKLIATAGRKQVIGRPILYKTTKEFLVRFGLKDVSELPSMEEFEKMAGELEETDELIEQSAEPNLPLAGSIEIEENRINESVETEAVTEPDTAEPVVTEKEVQE
jgi:segregation and condensation protein B